MSEKDFDQVPVTVTILKTETGECRDFKTALWFSRSGIKRDATEEMDSALFIWGDGNYSCDCNREQFFHEANGDTELAKRDIPCTDGRFKVRICLDSTGECVYSEFG